MTRYELLDRIGVGGMAEIFRGKAVAAGGFEKPVAIKRILPHLSQDPRFVELLIAEAKVLSLLKHRNIVQIFDVGLGDDGQYFLVMEFVDGKDVGAIQRALEADLRRIPFDLVLHIGAEICEALEHAVMSRGPDGKPMSLVHRDVSPSNVLVTRAGEVKLTDFGIAKRAEDATQGGAVRGKFAYISPEQARNEHVDPRSDVFSVGILMWELLCNRRLFSGLGDLEALRSVRDPQVRRPTEVDPRLPPAIDDIVMMALARDKTRRYPSAGAFGAKLRALRYSLDVTVGDPATELAKIIESTQQAERESLPGETLIRQRPEVESFAEATVIRIQTADAFSAREDEQSAIIAAREVIDRFEDQETRLAPLSSAQLRQLREAAPRDSTEMPAPTLPGVKRARAPSDEATSAHSPMYRSPGRAVPPGTIDARFDDDPPIRLPVTPVDGQTPPHQHFTPTEDTRLFQSRDRRTPRPQPVSLEPSTASNAARAQRPATAPPQTVSTRKPTPSVPPAISVPSVPPILLAPTLPGQPPPGAPVPSANVPQVAPSMPKQAPVYPNWDAPLAKDAGERPMYMARPPTASETGRPRGAKPTAKSGLQPWMLILGAVLVAILAFVITRAFIS